MSAIQPDSSDSTPRNADSAQAPVGADSPATVRHDIGRLPPAGEDIHLPPGTAIPLVIAVAITLMLVGTTTDWLWTIIGGVMFVGALFLWIRDTVREVAHLPDEHGSPAAHH